MILVDLFLGFLKVGLFSFGGAYGAIPLIRETVTGYGWMAEERLTDMIAVCESTPGPIMVNLATYVGSAQGGFIGAFVATTAVVLPAFVIILLAMAVLKRLLKSPYLRAVLRGLKPCIVGIILATGLSMLLKRCLGDLRAPGIDWKALVLTAVLAGAWYGAKKLRKKGLSPIQLIALSALAGILAYGWE